MNISRPRSLEILLKDVTPGSLWRVRHRFLNVPGARKFHTLQQLANYATEYISLPMGCIVFIVNAKPHSSVTNREVLLVDLLYEETLFKEVLFQCFDGSWDSKFEKVGTQ